MQTVCGNLVPRHHRGRLFCFSRSASLLCCSPPTHQEYHVLALTPPCVDSMFDAASTAMGGKEATSSAASATTTKSQRRRAKKQTRVLELESAIREATTEKPNVLLGRGSTMMDDDAEEWSFSTAAPTMADDGWMSGSLFGGVSGQDQPMADGGATNSALGLTALGSSSATGVANPVPLPPILGYGAVVCVCVVCVCTHVCVCCAIYFSV
jgi:hypothetical protein